MRCPKCGCQDDKVIDSRASREGAAIRRRRECIACRHRFTTSEEVERGRLSPSPMSVMPASTGVSRRRRILCRKLKNWRKKMILLRPDCLVFNTPTGESIPCSVDKVTVEFIGAGLDSLDKELVRNAAMAV